MRGASTPTTNNALQVVPQPMPGEMDYAWRRWSLEQRPNLARYRDLPIVSGSATYDEAGALIRAMRTLESGQFWEVALLADAFGFDDRIDGVLQTRVDALTSLPLNITARAGRQGDPASVAAAAAVTANWSRWFPGPEVKKLLRWGLLLRVGVGELLWSTGDDGRTWEPRLKTWDPRYLYWRWDTRSFWLITADGQVEVVPGDGHWILYCPDGYARGWMRGLIRSLAFLYMARRWAWRDWNRHSEIHGQPIKKAIVPTNAEPEDKESFRRDLENLASEGLVVVPDDGDGRKFDFTLVEAASQGWECFSKLIDKVDECVAVNVLGQNLSTSAKTGGSYALGEVQDRIRLDRLESDGNSLGDCLSSQAIEPWAHYNHGDREIAPLVGWSTKAPEDREKVAKTWQSLGVGLQELHDAGIHPDLDEVARRQLIPTTEETDGEDGDSGGAPRYKSLTGPQVTALTAVLVAVGTGALPKETAVQLIVTSFPANFSEDEARKMVDPIKPTVPAAPLAPAPVPAPPQLPP